MRAFLLVPALAACATTTAAAQFPTAEDVAALLLQRATCIADPPELAHCGANPERVVVHALRCRAASGGGHAGRALCSFSDQQLYASGRTLPGGPQCAYFAREGEGWRILNFPDADVCIDFMSQP